MKKTLLLSSALIGALSFSLLTGFDSSATVDQILSGYAQTTTQQEQLSADISILADAYISLPSQGIDTGALAQIDLDLDADMEPLALSENGSLHVDVLGQTMTLQNKTYVITENDGTLSLYQATNVEGQGDAQWTRSTTDAAAVSELIDKVAAKGIDFTKFPISFTLSAQPSIVNNAECYHLSTVMSADDIANCLEIALQHISQEAASSFYSVKDYISYLSGLTVNASLDIDANDYTLKKMHADTEGSDWSVIENMVPSLIGLGEGEAFSFDVNTFSIDITYDYTSPVVVELPEEALSAVDTSASDLLSMAEDAVG